MTAIIDLDRAPARGRRPAVRRALVFAGAAVLLLTPFVAGVGVTVGLPHVPDLHKPSWLVMHPAWFVVVPFVAGVALTWYGLQQLRSGAKHRRMLRPVSRRANRWWWVAGVIVAVFVNPLMLMVMASIWV